MMIQGQNSAAIVEITDRRIVDVTTHSYESRTNREVFVLILEQAAWLKVETQGGTVGRFFFPAGENSTHLRRIFSDENNDITTNINVGY